MTRGCCPTGMRSRLKNMWHVLVILTVRLGCSHGGDARTIVHPVAGEGGEQWNAVNLDCDPHAGPITIIRATYGVPCQPGCATCGNVALGNLDVDARSACDGEFKCVVASCPCTAGNVPPPGAKCDKHWTDPAKSCQKGLTVTYRCGDVAWGMPTVGLLLIAMGLYVGAGVAFGMKTTGGKLGLAAHPHYGHWQECRSLVQDGIAFSRGGGMARARQSADPGLRNGVAASEPLVADEGGKKKDRGKEKGGKDRKEKRGKDRKEKEGNGVAEAAPLAVEAQPAQREWQPTRSLLAQGARETGVKVGDHQPGQGLR